MDTTPDFKNGIKNIYFLLICVARLKAQAIYYKKHITKLFDLSDKTQKYSGPQPKIKPSILFKCEMLEFRKLINKTQNSCIALAI